MDEQQLTDASPACGQSHSTELLAGAICGANMQLKIDRDEIAVLIDELADLCQHWSKWKSRKHTPRTIRAAVLMLAGELHTLDVIEQKRMAALSANAGIHRAAEGRPVE